MGTMSNRVRVSSTKNRTCGRDGTIAREDGSVARRDVVRVINQVIYENLADYGSSDHKDGILLDGFRYMV